MKKYLFLILISLSVAGCLQKTQDAEVKRWEVQANRVNIIRDQWGVAHVYGKTDADAVFGMLYAQCEDDFNRVEVNYITSMGRMSEVTGSESLYSDLRMRLFNDSTKALALYNESAPWLKALCDAFADGINYYLHTHPEVEPKLIKRFQPWMPFVFSEGSIGGDIETISTRGLKEFYDKSGAVSSNEKIEGNNRDEEPRGSNGFAIAPSLTESGNVLLLINPHTSYYFRNEIHVISEEGLNTYGAVTWGQFFVYQGFNENCGWMHTSSRADAIDHYVETVENKNGEWSYKYGDEWKPMMTEKVTINFKENNEEMSKDFLVYRTQHGPVIAEEDGKWITIRLMQEPVKALTQSFMRTKANDYDAFNETMKLLTNSSNNTVFADSKGNIAYYHGNFIPVRDQKFDWSKEVDGSNPQTDWKGLHTVDQMVHIKNPANGWIQNCNSTPFTASGSSSPNKSEYPDYMAPDFENTRGLHAVAVLSGKSDFTIDKLIDAAYDPYLTGFEQLIPSLIKSYDNLKASKDDMKDKLREPIELLKKWDLTWGEKSVPTTLAVFWGHSLRQKVVPRMKGSKDQLSIIEFMNNAPAIEKLQSLAEVIDQLSGDFGDWKTPWGDVNRFQRLTGDIEPTFDDDQPSIPIGYTSSFWGSLASVGSRPYPATKKWYGTSGNSFVAVVEFGEKVKAKAILSGGVSGNPTSPHFVDQAKMFCKGELKDVLFYKEDVEQHVKESYHPGGSRK